MTDREPFEHGEVTSESVRSFLWRLRARMLAPGDADRAQRDLDEILSAAKQHAHTPAGERVVVLRRISPFEGLGRIAAAVVLLAGASGGAVQLAQISRAPATPTTDDVQALEVVEVPVPQEQALEEGSPGGTGSASSAQQGSAAPTGPDAAGLPEAQATPDAEVTPEPAPTDSPHPDAGASPAPETTSSPTAEPSPDGSTDTAGSRSASAGAQGAEECEEPDQRPRRTRSADERDCADPEPSPSPSPEPSPTTSPEAEEPRHDYEDRSRLNP